MKTSTKTTNFLMALSVAAASSSFSAYAAESSGKKDKASHTQVVPSDQAQGTELDVETTRQIRAELTKSSGLSVDAHNVKIVTLKGMVHLRGPVASQDEKNRVETMARAVIGDSKYKVNNELTIK